MSDILKAHSSPAVPTAPRSFQLAPVIWIAAIALTAYFILLPLGYIVGSSFFEDGVPTLDRLSRYVFEDASMLVAARNSLIFAVSVAVFSVLVGVPLAFGVARTNMGWKELVRTTVLIAIITPPFLRTMAYILLFGPNAGEINVALRWLFFPELDSGPFNVYSLTGLILLSTPIGIAQVFILTSTALNQMDPSLEEAARTGGAGPVATVFRVTLPICRNAILAGALMSFAIALSLYGTPHLLGIEVITTRIREALLMPIDFARAAVLSTVVTMIGLVALVAYRHSTRNAGRFQTITGKGFRPAVMRLGPSRHAFTALGIAYGFLSFVLPCGALVAMSFFPTVGTIPSLDELTLSHYAYLWSAGPVWRAVTNSLVLAVLTATVCCGLAIVIGYLIVRTRFRGRAVLDYIVVLPLAVSGIAIAVGLVLVYTSQPFVELRFYGTRWLLLLAYVALMMPIAVRAVQTSLMQIGAELEEAARVAGASWLQTMARINLPLIRQGVGYAWVLVFLGVIPELSASIILRQLGNDTVATILLDLWGGAGGFQRAAALGTVMFLLTAFVFFLTRRITGRDAFGARQSREPAT